MYATLLETASEHVDRLQIIVTDNDSPPIGGIHRALELSDTDRLVPTASAHEQSRDDDETGTDGLTNDPA